VNRTYIKVLIGWNTSTKSASDEFGFRKLEIYPRNCQSTLKKDHSQASQLNYNLEGSRFPRAKTYFPIFYNHTMTDLGPAAKAITDKVNNVTVHDV
jgi:hypothetical protein